MQDILIPLSKKKLRLFFFLSLVFIAIGIFCIPVKQEFYLEDFKISVTGLGYFFIIFFAITGTVMIWKMTDKSPKLIIDQQGITDKTSNTEIFWRDIIKLSIFETHHQKMLMVHVSNPQEYIDKQTRALNRKSMWVNYKMHGTPLSINTAILDISLDELVKIINERCNFLLSAHKE